MTKQTEQETSPDNTGEVKQESTTTPQENVDTNKQGEDKAKQEKEAKKKASEQAKQAKQEKEALKQAELEVQKLANELLLNGYQYRGRKYNFTTNMPLKINLDGEIFTQEEIMSNPDIIESMIDSKNIFIKEI